MGLTAVRKAVNSLQSSVVVHELQFAINRALYVFMKLREPIHHLYIWRKKAKKSI